MSATQPAAPKTAEELADQIHALTNIDAVGGDGYSQSADALWKAALLAFNYAADKVGATGFQAGYSALKFYGEALHIDGPFGVVMADHALYPQYDEVAKVRDWIGDEWRPWLIEQATKRLAENYGLVHPNVLARWRVLASEATS
jgi:hypothetical protein